jgi:1-deoxy-D-xylulose-5-phosphate synthase
MTYKLLSAIHSPEDFRDFSSEELSQLKDELRAFIIDVVSTKEGHLGASLGVVELSIALHYVFNTPKDQLVWDVGHQAYGHKILTGRREVFETNRQLNGISGFPKLSESQYDTFGVGHSSTSISAALGMAMASQLKGDYDTQHIAVIGDASIASGMAFEGLNHAGVTSANLLVILNDNAIGIDPSVGALKTYLTKAKIGHKPRQDNIIEALNFSYEGPIDGHDLPQLIKTLNRLKTKKGPQFLHVITKKGKGLPSAEQDQVTYHAPGKFNKYTGERVQKDQAYQPPKFQDIFGLSLVELARQNQSIVGITPAMPTGSSLKFMMQEFPERAFDVGIAEQHAVTLAAGLATQGLKVFCTIYSTFLQRAYDQVIHDVALQNLPVVFCIDRAGLVGRDGATHHGVFDLAYLNCIPNLVIAAPRDGLEFRHLLYTASQYYEHPIAIRYPRGASFHQDWQHAFKSLPIGQAEELTSGQRIAVLSIGHIAEEVKQALKLLPTEVDPAHYDFKFLKPLDVEMLSTIIAKFEVIVTVEDASVIGGLGDAVSSYLTSVGATNKLVKLGLPDHFIEHGSTKDLYQLVGLTASQLAHKIASL